MKKTLTKATAMALAFILLFGSAAAGIGGFAQVLDTISIRASAEELKYGDLTYSVENGEVTITGCDINATTVDIPSEIDGYPVTSIGSYAISGGYEGSGLTSVTIPDSVKSIGNKAFYFCRDLTSVTIGNSVERIGEYAFWGCRGINELTIPENTSFIGEGAFGYCSFEEIFIPKSVSLIKSSIFFGCENLESIFVSVENSNYHSASNCLIETESKTLVAGCKSSIIPDDGSVTSIGEGAFNGCTGPTGKAVPDSVKSIGERAFQGCKGLTNLTIPKSVTSIGEDAFNGCTGLESISVDASNPVYLGKSNCLIEKDSKTLIAGCKNSIIPDDGSVTNIAEGVFSHCTLPTSIIIPDSVKYIGDYAFYDCDGIKSITISDGVTNIGENTFGWCTDLTSVTIGNGIKKISDDAFYNCENLKDVYYNGTEKDREKNLSVKSGNDYLLNATWHYAEIRLENAKINVKSDEVYKNSKVTVTATAENVPEGYYLAVYDSGNEPIAKGDNKAVKYEIPGKVASDKTLTVKVVDADNNTQKDGNGKDLTAEINIKVKTGFFDILIAFFRMIFGMNKVTIKP